MPKQSARQLGRSKKKKQRACWDAMNASRWQSRHNLDHLEKLWISGANSQSARISLKYFTVNTRRERARILQHPEQHHWQIEVILTVSAKCSIFASMFYRCFHSHAGAYKRFSLILYIRVVKDFTPKETAELHYNFKNSKTLNQQHTCLKAHQLEIFQFEFFPYHVRGLEGKLPNETLWVCCTSTGDCNL